MHIGVPAETRAGETRIAATAETVKKLIAQGHTVTVESGAGTAAGQPDSLLREAGATIGSREDAFRAQIVLKVRSPDGEEVRLIAEGHPIPLLQLEEGLVHEVRANRFGRRLTGHDEANRGAKTSICTPRRCSAHAVCIRTPAESIEPCGQ